MKSDKFAIMTPQTHLNHETIGQLFVGPSVDGCAGIYYCDSYDPRQGFWMTHFTGQRRTNVSERAINGTFHRINFDQYPDRLHVWSRFGNPF